MAWAFVTGASTKTKTVTKNVTAGNLLVCGFACGDGTTTPTISDGVNSWTAVTASPTKDVTNAASVSMWWAIAATTASITITITAAPTTFNGTWVGEWSGNAAASLADGSAGAANIAGSLATDGQRTGSFTPAVNGDLIVSFAVNDGTSETTNHYNAGTNFTERTTCAQDPAGLNETTYSVEECVQATAGAINPPWTELHSDATVGIGAAFKVLAAAAAKLPRGSFSGQAVKRAATY